MSSRLWTSLLLWIIPQELHRWWPSPRIMPWLRVSAALIIVLRHHLPVGLH